MLATTLGPALCIFLTLLLPPPRIAMPVGARRGGEPPITDARHRQRVLRAAGRPDRGGSERTRGLTATYRFDVADAGSWRVAVDDGTVAVSESDGAADCVISAPEDLFLRINHGQQSLMGAFLMGKIRVEGDTGLAMRLKPTLASAPRQGASR